MRLQALLAAVFLPGAFSTFQDEAGHVDFHYALLGLPQADTTFFHQPDPSSRATLLYTLSEKHLLGAVNPKDGTLLWRHRLPGNETDKSFLVAGNEQDTVVSGLGNTVTAWGAFDGKVAWKKIIHDGEIQDVRAINGPGGQDAGEKDVLVLTSGTASKLQLLDGSNGEQKWVYDDKSRETPLAVSVSPTIVSYISLQKSMLGSSKLNIKQINPKTGGSPDEYNPTSELSSVEDILHIGSNTNNPMMVWTEKGFKVLKVHILQTKEVASFNVRTSSKAIEKIAVHASTGAIKSPEFLVHFQTPDEHWAEVYNINVAKSVVLKSYDIPATPGRGVFSQTIVDGKAYYTRVAETEISLYPSVSQSTLGKWPIDLTSPGSAEKVYPIHAASEVSTKSAPNYAVRSAVLLSNGDWVLFRNGEAMWTRHEDLAGTVRAEWAVQMQPKEALLDELEVEEHSNSVTAFLHRISRHARDAQDVLSWVRQHMPTVILNKLRNIEHIFKGSTSQHETFGLNKLVVAVTDSGRVFGIEAGNAGNVAWNIKATSGETLTHASAQGILEKISDLTGKPDLSLIQSRPMPKIELDSSNAPKTPAEVSYSVQDGSLQGHKGDRTVWHFLPKKNQKIISVTSRFPYEPVASIGKVLGDRRVLYKYLNPNAIILVAADESKRTISVTLIDSVSGGVFYSEEHTHVDTTRAIPAVISENWFSYSFCTDDPDDTKSRGCQLVMGEVYESEIPNDRGPLGSSGNYSNTRPSPSVAQTVKPYVATQTFLLPEEISKLAVTQTGQGITSRQLLVSAANSNNIIAIPRQVLDPRRTVGKDPTSDQQTEGLTRYTPMVDFDPKWVLNHKREVLGVERMMTTPAALESTSLIFAYGHDLFGTRVTPSFAFDILGNAFNKVQLIMTVGALTCAVFIVAPFIQRKQTNTLWGV